MYGLILLFPYAFSIMIFPENRGKSQKNLASRYFKCEIENDLIC